MTDVVPTHRPLTRTRGLVLVVRLSVFSSFTSFCDAGRSTKRRSVKPHETTVGLAEAVTSACAGPPYYEVLVLFRAGTSRPVTSGGASP